MLDEQSTFAQCQGSYINAKGMRRSFGPGMDPKVHEAALPASVAETLDGVATAMGVAHRTGDVEEEVAALAAKLAPAEPEPAAENTEEDKES